MAGARSASAGASINYTTDGSTPSATVGTPYTSPITVSSMTTIKAVAYGGGSTTSTISKAKYMFTVTGPAVTLAPNVLNMMVGDTAAIQALNAASQPIKGLVWTTSDSTVVSLSNNDPPTLTAVAPGQATITAGGASASVTVSANPLPIGTVLWSNPGNGAELYSIVPAVPSSTGVADVFAFLGDGSVQAIRSDGTTAWTADVSQAGATYLSPALADFEGGLVASTGPGPGVAGCIGPMSIVKYDGKNGSRAHALYDPIAGMHG